MMNPFRRGNVYYRTYQAKDGALAVACLSDRLRKRVADVLGLDDPRFGPDYDPFSEEAQTARRRASSRSRSAVQRKDHRRVACKSGTSVGVPAGPVRFVQEMLDDEQVAANGLAVDLEHTLAGPVRMVGPMIQMSKTPLAARSASPALGRAYRRQSSENPATPNPK